MVVNNWPELIRPLHLGRALVVSAAPWRKPKSGQGPGLQVDLLLQTRRALYVVEIKRQREIGHEIEDEVSRKIANLPLRAGMTPRPVLVYDGHLSPSVEGSGFFDVIVPASKLLGL